MEPGTPLLSTADDVSYSGRRSAPPSALAPPNVLLPSYPSSMLNNYYIPSTSFIHHEQNNVHTSAAPSPIFFDPNILPPSASQSHIPTLQRTPSSSLRSVPSPGSLRPENIALPCSPAPLSPLIFQPHTHPQNFNNTVQPRRHSIFSPQIINSPLPRVPHLPRNLEHHTPTPNIAHQPVHPILPLNLANSPAVPYFFPSPSSVYSHHSSSSLPTLLKISLPSTKDIPLLTGKHDWGLWHLAVNSLILCSNLLSHISEALLPGAAYDPDLWPTYPPVIQPESGPAERIEFSNWWSKDGVVTHILTSRLLPTVLSSLPVANLRLAQRRSARDIYQTLRSNYGAGDYSAVMVIEAKLRQLRCLPTRGGVRVPDYVATWRTGFNQMEAAGHLPSERQILAMFVDGLPTNAVPYVTLSDNVLNSLNDTAELLNIHHLFDHVICIENNLLRTRLLNQSQCQPSIASLPSSSLNPSKAAATTSTSPANAAIICGNCGRPHPMDKCFQPGGAMEGKRAEVLSNRPPQPQAHLAEINEEVEPDKERRWSQTRRTSLTNRMYLQMSLPQCQSASPIIFHFPRMLCLPLLRLIRIYHWHWLRCE